MSATWRPRAFLLHSAAAVRYRVPKITLLRMGLNLGVDYVFGSVPIVGIFRAWWKSNQRRRLLKSAPPSRLRMRAAEDYATGSSCLSSCWFCSLVGGSLRAFSSCASSPITCNPVLKSAQLSKLKGDLTSEVAFFSVRVRSPVSGCFSGS